MIIRKNITASELYSFYYVDRGYRGLPHWRYMAAPAMLDITNSLLIYYQHKSEYRVSVLSDVKIYLQKKLNGHAI